MLAFSRIALSVAVCSCLLQFGNALDYKINLLSWTKSGKKGEWGLLNCSDWNVVQSMNASTEEVVELTWRRCENPYRLARVGDELPTAEYKELDCADVLRHSVNVSESDYFLNVTDVAAVYLCTIFVQPVDNFSSDSLNQTIYKRKFGFNLSGPSDEAEMSDYGTRALRSSIAAVAFALLLLLAGQVGSCVDKALSKSNEREIQQLVYSLYVGQQSSANASGFAMRSVQSHLAEPVVLEDARFFTAL